MARVEYLRQVEILNAHLRHYARISENKPFFGLWENDGEAGLLGWKFSNSRYVHAAFPEAFEAQFAQRIIADSGMEAHTVPEKRKVVRKNCRRAAERET